MNEFKSITIRKGSLLATVRCQLGKVVNQSSSLVKERFRSYHFEISHDKISSKFHGISRIVKGIDFHKPAHRIKEFKSIVHYYLNEGMNNRDPEEQNPSFLTKKLYIPNGSLQLLKIYVRNDYIRHLNG